MGPTHPDSHDQRAHGEAIVYDWNTLPGGALERPPFRVEVLDETLRDGIQSPSAEDPPVEAKIEILRLMDAVGLDAADVGLPAASDRNFQDVVRICRTLRDEKMRLSPTCAGRTVVSDVTRIVEASQASGVPIEVYTFIGSSPIRQLAEDWSMDLQAKRTRAAVRAGVSEGLAVTYVTEDTTRAHPEDLRVLFRSALDEGATALCLCDTVGHATPDGARGLVRWTRRLLDGWGFDQVRIDWHGHNDRGLSLANALAAATGGASRLHGTALGIGERVGNAATDQLLVNLWLLGWSDRDLSSLSRYCHAAGEALSLPIAKNYPVVGGDAFRTATGVHASAIFKAHKKGDAWLADRVYSGVPASAVGRHQQIELGPMSGKSNAIFWMRDRDIEPTNARIRALLAAAKSSPHTLSERECLDAIEGR